MGREKRGGKLIRYKGQVVSIAPGVIGALLFLTPGLAAASECGPEAAGPDTVTCTGGPFNDGIRYRASDGLTLVIDDPALFVSRSDRTPAIVVESNNNTSEDVVLIVRRIDSVTRTEADANDILVQNNGFGAARAEFESGVVFSLNPSNRAGGIGAIITNAENAEDATVILRGGEFLLGGELSAGALAVTQGRGNANIVVEGGSIRTTNPLAPGVYGVVSQFESGSSVNIRISAGDIQTSGDGFSLNNLPFATVPHGAWALVGSKGDASILMDGGAITTTGNFAYGAASEVQSLLGDNGDSNANVAATMTGGSIRTEGDFSHGLVARTFLSISNATARARLEGGRISTSGENTVALLASNWGQNLAEATMTGGEISTSGEGGTGIMALVRDRASGHFARVNMSGGSVATSGSLGHGIHSRAEIDASAEVAMTGGDILTTGDTALGIFAERSLNFGEQAVDIRLEGGSITTTGNGAIGVLAFNRGNGGIRFQSAADITTSGIDADAVLLASQFGTFDVDITGGRIKNGFRDTAAIRTLSLDGGTIDIHAGAVVEGNVFESIIDGDGDTVLRVAGEVLYGVDMGGGDDTAIYAGNSYGQAFDYAMGDGADTFIIEGNANLSRVAVLSGDSLTGPADGQIDHLIVRGDGAPQTPRQVQGWEILSVDQVTLNVLEDYDLGTAADQGLFLTNGARYQARGLNALTGNVAINAGTVYAGQSSPSIGRPGSLEITGAVHNAGTITFQDGVAHNPIEIIGDYTGGGMVALDVDFAAGSSDTLRIAGDVHGPATLLSVADVSAAPATAAPISLVEVTGAADAADFVLAGGAVTSGAYTYALSQTGSTWQLTPGVSAAAGGYQSAGYVLGVFASGSDTLNLLGLSPVSAAGTGRAAGAARGSWVQTAVSRFDTALSGGTSGDLSGHTYELQFGHESALDSDGTGTWVLGLTGHIGTYSASAVTTGGTSKISARAFGLGVTGRWQGPQGYFFGAAAEFSRLRLDYESGGAMLTSGETAFSFGASAVFGQRIALSSAATLTPSAQVDITHVTGQTFTDSNGTVVDISSDTRVTARLGLGYERQLSQTGAIYAKASVLHDFSAASSASVGGVALTGSYEDSWVEVGIGGRTALRDHTSLYGDLAYKRGLDQGGSALSLNAGIQMVW